MVFFGIISLATLAFTTLPVLVTLWQQSRPEEEED